MSLSLIRRLDDAFCAFRTGHSRRDLDRVRRRRLLLLGTRMLHRRERRAREAPYFQDHYRASADAAAHLLQQLPQRGYRIVAPLLVQQLEIDRMCLRSRRKDAWSQVRSLDGPDEYSLQVLKAAPVFSDEFYGKLHEGLLEDGGPHFFHDKLRLCAGYGHRLFLALKVRRVFCIRGKLPARLLSQGRYPADPGFGTVGDCRPARECGHA